MVSYTFGAFIAFLVGFVFSESIIGYTSALIAVITVATIVCIILYYKKIKHYWLIVLIPTMVLVGSLSPYTRTASLHNNLKNFCDKEITLYATVISYPKPSGEKNYSFVVRANHIIYEETRYDFNDKIKITSENTVRAGDALVIKGKLSAIRKKMNSTSFDAANYYSERGIAYSTYAKEQDIADKQNIGIFDTLSIKYINYINDFIDNSALSDSSKQILRGIILNNKSLIDEDTKLSMKVSGLYRFIYYPHIHIAVLMFLISLVKSSFKKRYITMLLILGIYLMLNFTIPSAWKICVCIVISHTFMLKFSNYRKERVLMVTVIAVGILSPFTLKNSGFILSAVATLIIMAFAEPLNYQPSKMRIKPKAAKLISCYLIFTLGLFPIASFFGYSLTPFSFIMGLVFVPIIMVIYFLFMLTAFLLPFISTSIFVVIDFLITKITFVSDLIYKLPFSVITFPRADILLVVATYLIFYGIYLIKRLRGGGRIAICIAASLLLVFDASSIYKHSLVDITFLNVGQSDGTIITLPSNKIIMIDGGGSADYSDYNIAEAEVIPFLQSKGINKIDYAILSHFHKDHADGIYNILKSMPVKELFIPDYLSKTNYRAIIETELSKQNTTVHRITNNCSYQFSDDANGDFYYSDLQRNNKEENNSSLVFKFNYGYTSVLFTGDIEKSIEYTLDNIDCDIIKVPHHGSKTSNSINLMEKASPSFAICFVAENNSYNLPNKTTVKNYTDRNCKFLITDECGDIHFLINKNNIKCAYCYKKGVFYYGQ